GVVLTNDLGKARGRARGEVSITAVACRDGVITELERADRRAGGTTARQGDGRAKLGAVDAELHRAGWRSRTRHRGAYRDGEADRLVQERRAGRGSDGRRRAILADGLGEGRGGAATKVRIAAVDRRDRMAADGQCRGGEGRLAGAVERPRAQRGRPVLEGDGARGYARARRNHANRRREGDRLAKDRRAGRRSQAGC